MKIIVTIFAIFLLASCAWHDTIYVPEGAPVRLREDVKADIWAYSQGKGLPGDMVLKEGWFCMSMSEEELKEMGLDDIEYLEEED